MVDYTLSYNRKQKDNVGEDYFYEVKADTLEGAIIEIKDNFLPKVMFDKSNGDIWSAKIISPGEKFIMKKGSLII